MKEFRKTEEGLFICEECGFICKICSTLSAHIGKHHNKRDYFDKWLKDEKDGICPTCGKSTKYLNRWDRGYAKYCCTKCKRMSDEAIEKMLNSSRKTCLIRYGVETFMGTKVFKEKTKETCIEKYGVDNPSKNKNVQLNIKTTKMKRYGDQNYNNSEKRIKTNIEKYGGNSPFNSNDVKLKASETCLYNYNVDHPFKSKIIIENRKQTWIANYGVDNPNKNLEIIKKGIDTRLKIKKYLNTNLNYQGSYELDFLNKYYNKFLYISRGPTIKYTIDNKNHYYFPDFYIPELHLIIECKSSWTLNVSIDIKKKEATIANGFNYIMILDKNYSELESYLQK